MNNQHKKITISFIAFILFSLLCIYSNFNIVFANELDNEINKSTTEITSSAKSMFLFDANTKREIYTKNCNQKLALASTTKIVTAITTLENFKGNLDEKIIVPNDAVGLEGTSMYLKKGEQVSVRELLYGLMLPSGNDAGKALALITSETESEFCNLMNEIAIKAGAKNSNFVNSHGLDQDGHYTTARDLALITAYALENPTFKEIVSTKNVVIDETNKYQTRYFKNKNKLLFEFEDCIGVKTGFTDNAGRCLVSATESNGTKFICVVLNCPDMFEESSRLIKMAKNEFQNYCIINKEVCIDSISVKNGKMNEIRLFPLESFNALLTKNEYENLNIIYDYPDEVEAPINIQDNLGSIKVFLNEDLIFETKICSIDSVKSISTLDLFKDILSNWS